MSQHKMRKTTSTGKNDQLSGLLTLQTKSFLSLPAEIRLMIYEYAATIHPIGCVKLSRRSAAGSGRGFSDCFNMLASCSQVRSEFQSIYYREARFAVPKDVSHIFLKEMSDIGVALSNLTLIIPDLGHPIRPKKTTIRNGRFSNFDYLPFLESWMRHPDCSVEVGTWDVNIKSFVKSESTQRALDMLLKPSKGNIVLKDTVRKKHLSQVLINQSIGNRSELRLIYKVPHEEEWMRQLFGVNAKREAHAKKLGFVEENCNMWDLQGVKISFAVRYF